MGFLKNNNGEIEIITKLTKEGKEKLLQNGTDLIKYFRVGDSDANYLVSGSLPIGLIPTNGSDSSSVTNNVSIKSIINLDGTNSKYKEILSDSINVVSNTVKGGEKIIETKGEIININDKIKGNLFKSFNLPLTTNEKAQFLTTHANGGYLNTVLADLRNDEIILIPIEDFGNIIDGSDIKISVGLNSGEIWDLYSTYSSQIDTNENKISDNHPIVKNNLKNSVLLFSDNVKKPTNGKSWSSGHKAFKPFKNGGKVKYNFGKDKAVGFVSLDLGFVIITNREIISKFNGEVKVEYNYFVDEVFQTINLTLGRNEFFISNNKTFDLKDSVRISEFELLDKDYKVIAYAKLNTQLLKRKHEQISINVKIMV